MPGVRWKPSSRAGSTACYACSCRPCGCTGEKYETQISPKTWNTIRLHELDSSYCIHKRFGDLRGDTAEINCSFQKLQFWDDFLATCPKISNNSKKNGAFGARTAVISRCQNCSSPRHIAATLGDMNAIRRIKFVQPYEKLIISVWYTF